MTDPLLKKIGARIREARSRVDISQRELAQRLGKTQDAISGYESGARALRITELPTLASALGVPVEYFFEDTASPVIRPAISEMINLMQQLPDDLQDVALRQVETLVMHSRRQTRDQ
jgi:transcriptional regulator with XRE-family HTH domain